MIESTKRLVWLSSQSCKPLGFRVPASPTTLLASLTACTLLLTTAGLAQTKPQPKPTALDPDRLFSLIQIQQDAGDDETEATIAEDMEVLSTIVHENIQATYTRATTAMLGSAGLDNPHLPDQWRELIGTPSIAEPLFDHLPGRGVSIQMRIPAVRPEKPKSAPPEDAAQSRWEQTRKRLRGEGGTALGWRGVKCEGCHVPPFARSTQLRQPKYYDWTGQFHHLRGFEVHGVDGFPKWAGDWVSPRPTQAAVIQAVMDTLADNGHNLRGLRPDEYVTISLSYWESERVAKPLHENEGASEKSSSSDTDGADEIADKGDAASESDTSANQPDTNASESVDEANASNADKVPSSEIDQVILETLKKLGLPESEDRGELVRRLYIDLTGLPPSEKQVQEFLADGSADAYSRFFDRIFATNKPYDSFVRAQLGVTKKVQLPSRTRISVSATTKQLTDVANGKLSRIDFTRGVEVRVFVPKK